MVYKIAAINDSPPPILALLFPSDPAVEVLLGSPVKAMGCMIS